MDKKVSIVMNGTVGRCWDERCNKQMLSRMAQKAGVKRNRNQALIWTM